MSDFDDLLPRVPSTANLTLENPFDDPFADVTRPAADPWAMASFYHTHQQAQEPEVPTFSTAPDEEAEGHHDRASPEPPSTEMGSMAPLTSANPDLSGTLADDMDHSSPVIVRQPNLAEPKPLEDTRELEPPTVLVTNDAPHPVAPPSPETTISPSLSVRIDPAHSISVTPSPSESSVVAQHAPSLLSSAVSGRPPSSRFSTADATPRYDRIVSPLDTPDRVSIMTSADRPFSGLSLGGEVPGWGAVGPGGGFASQTTDASHDDETEIADESATASKEDIRSESTDTSSPQKDATSTPVFRITVGDPQKVGDPLSAHIIYTVQTKTTATNFRKSEFSVLRRYSDFLWLFETLSSNNPGVVVPPVPEKNSFSRFQNSFVESRRLALNKCIQKIANHAILSQDPDFKLFIESDSLALDIKHRKPEGTHASGGIMATLTGPKFYETDEWFDRQKVYLDGLESQLRGLGKAIEAVSKQRTEMALAIGELVETVGALASSDLSKQLSYLLGILADLEKKSKDAQQDQAKDDMVSFLGTVEEYCRLINSVRLAFATRIKCHTNWQLLETEATRVKVTNEKNRKQGRIPSDRITHAMNEVAEAERRAQDAKRDFEKASRLMKTEFVRFEQERVEDFKASLDQFLEGMITKQKQLIVAWESYQDILLKRAGTNPNAPVPQAQHPVEPQSNVL